MVTTLSMTHSQVQWVAEGAKNRRFFHLRASQRKKNKTNHLWKLDGKMTKDPSVEWCSWHVTGGMNKGLIATITNSDVRDAIFHMYHIKEPELESLLAHVSSIIGIQEKSHIYCVATGIFVSSQPGPSHLTLEAEARAWGGNTCSSSKPWCPSPYIKRCTLTRPCIPSHLALFSLP
jgi:hypothetical protein